MSVHKLESKVILLNQIKVLKDMIKQFLPLCLFLEKKKTKENKNFMGILLTLSVGAWFNNILSHPLSVNALCMGI